MKDTSRFIALLAAALATGGARAESPRQPLSPAYVEECGACHVAYPPALLAADSWRAVMAGLDRHFGNDASLDAAKAKPIAAWLATHAARRATADAAGRPLLRISETAWFRHEHRAGHEGLTAAVWRSKAVGSPANCAACHSGAARGDYAEDGIRLPH